MITFISPCLIIHIIAYKYSEAILSHIYRFRNEVLPSITDKIKENWSPPSHALVHWDGKLMETLDGSSSEERLPALVSGVGGPKLLGVPSLPPAEPGQPFGDLIATETVLLLQEWGAADSIRGMVFDTTSTNTGI